MSGALQYLIVQELIRVLTLVALVLVCGLGGPAMAVATLGILYEIKVNWIDK